MEQYAWADSIQAAVIVCDRAGIIIYMNQTSQMNYAKNGGAQLIGKSLFDCHNPASIGILKMMLADGSSNKYTIQKNGKKKMILQTPFFENDIVAGLVEITFEIPEDMPHHNRDV